jgi:hypothetical protein
MSLPTGVSKIAGPGMMAGNVLTATRAPTSADNSNTECAVGDIWITQDGDSARAYINMHETDPAAITLAITSLATTTLTLDASEGDKVVVGDTIEITADDVTEHMTVTAIVDDVLTVTRGVAQRPMEASPDTVTDAEVTGASTGTIVNRDARYATWAAICADTAYAVA